MLTCTEHDVIYSILALRFARIHFWFKYEAVNISNRLPLKDRHCPINYLHYHIMMSNYNPFS